MKILFLDDEINRFKSLQDKLMGRAEIVWVTSHADFTTAIHKDNYDLIMLDHDLGWENDEVGWNGTEAMKYLVENRTYLGDDQCVVIHSTNSCGVANMMAQAKYADHLQVLVVPFAWNRVSVKDDGKLHFLLT